jgi:hypothetical protein
MGMPLNKYYFDYKDGEGRGAQQRLGEEATLGQGDKAKGFLKFTYKTRRRFQ